VPYRWIVLAVGVAGTMVVGALRQGLPALGPAVRDAFALSVSEVGLVFGALAVGMTIALVPFGALADRLGERLVLAAGLTATAGAVGLAALAGSFGLLLAGLFLMGAFGASATGASGRAVMGWFSRRERGLALGIRQTAIPLGGALAALTLPAIAIASGLDAALLALAGFTLAAAVLSALLMRDPPPPPANRPVVEAPPPMRDARIWRLGLGSGLLVMAQAAVIGFVVLFLADERGLAVTDAALVLAAIQIGAAGSRIWIGIRSDRLERRIVPMRHTALAGAVLLAAAAALSDAPGWVVLPLLVAAGVAISSWNGLAFTAAAEMSGRARAGTAMSLQNTLVSVLSAATAPLFGLLVDATSYQAAYLAVAVAPVAGWWVLRPLEGEEDRRADARATRLAYAERLGT
jgi:sugar phosphate permease